MGVQSDFKKAYNEVFDWTLPNNKYKGPETSVRMDHAVSIRSSGATIGMIQEWSPQQSRNVTPIYEINAAALGKPSESIPSILTGLSISISRYDLYASRMENVWGAGLTVQVLTDQTNPFTINERWDNPNGSVEMWTYTGCWFTSVGRTHSANGDRITKVNASLMYTDKHQISSSKIASQEQAAWAANKITNEVASW